MTVLPDTDIVSELLRPSPDPAVETWAREYPAANLHSPAVSKAELRCGAAILPAGRRRKALALAIGAILREDFDDRVPPFDSAAARACADIAAAGPMAPADCRIAAIVRSRTMAVATRNVRDFEDCGVEVIDPRRHEGAG